MGLLISIMFQRSLCVRSPLVIRLNYLLDDCEFCIKLPLRLIYPISRYQSSGLGFQYSSFRKESE